jgi:DNA-binding response OmpR family regulator
MKLLVIEDEPRMRESLEAGLRQHGFDVESTGLGAEGEEMAVKTDYDLIVLDVMLPDREGTEVCQNLRRQGLTTPVLMLTALAATDEKIDGLNAGADDYLTKPFEFAELVARIRAILRRGQASETRTLRYGDIELDLYSRSATRGGKTFELSNKEFMLLELLMRHPNRVLTRPFIGEKVWDMNFDPTSNVIDVYIAMLRKQIDKDFDEPLIHTIKGAGYRFGTRE